MTSQSNSSPDQRPVGWATARDAEPASGDEARAVAHPAKTDIELHEAMDMGVEELVSAAGTLHSPPAFASRCRTCGRFVSVLTSKEQDNERIE